MSKKGGFQMSKGIIYVMTTAVAGLIKIGKTRTDQFENRMRQLESNGYSNVVALKRCFAIEVDDYDEKETLLHEIFSKSQVGDSELFALNKELVIRLLSSFEGSQIFPRQEKKDSFEQAEIASQEGLEGQYFHNDKNGSVVAVLKMVGGRYILCAKSILAQNYDGINPPGWRKIRESLKLSKDGKLSKDLECSSPSMAAALVAGGARSGFSFWKNKEGKTMKDLIK